MLDAIMAFKGIYHAEVSVFACNKTQYVPCLEEYWASVPSVNRIYEKVKGTRATIEIVRALEPLGTDVAKESKAKVLEAARYCFAEERECEEEHANSDVNILRLSEPVQSGAKESLKSLPVKTRGTTEAVRPQQGLREENMLCLRLKLGAEQPSEDRIAYSRESRKNTNTAHEPGIRGFYTLHGHSPCDSETMGTCSVAGSSDAVLWSFDVEKPSSTMKEEKRGCLNGD
ncbi:hypothetical protein C8J57DRAFT_1252121 [Mycena rebaudengoi]|nr:hypothetical protein C8J57DRAFT_1252121 [Mycena rebaudengoi]